MTTVNILSQEGGYNFIGNALAALDDVDAPDSNDVTTGNPRMDSMYGYRFQDPATPSGAQTFRAHVYKTSNGSNNNPTVRFDLLQIVNVGESPQLIREGAEIEITSETGEIVEFDWNASELLNATAERVVVHLHAFNSGGSPKKRDSVNLKAIQWEAS